MTERENPIQGIASHMTERENLIREIASHMTERENLIQEIVSHLMEKENPIQEIVSHLTEKEIDRIDSIDQTIDTTIQNPIQELPSIQVQKGRGQILNLSILSLHAYPARKKSRREQETVAQSNFRKKKRLKVGIVLKKGLLIHHNIN